MHKTANPAEPTNVRVSFTEGGGVGEPALVQADSYYPFGMRLPGLSITPSDENPYLYNGKELEDDYGLNLYHYGARYLTPCRSNEKKGKVRERV